MKGLEGKEKVGREIGKNASLLVSKLNVQPGSVQLWNIQVQSTSRSGSSSS